MEKAKILERKQMIDTGTIEIGKLEHHNIFQKMSEEQAEVSIFQKMSREKRLSKSLKSTET